MCKYTRIIIIAILVALQVIFGLPACFYGTAPYLQRCFLYSFFHANWFHLAVNCIAIWTIFDPRRKMSFLQLVSSFIIALLVYPLSFRPVVGFSNVLYATLGLRTPALSSSWWKQPAVIVFIIATIAMVFIPQISATTHVAAFLLGMAGASLRRAWLKLTDDARRYF